MDALVQTVQRIGEGLPDLLAAAALVLLGWLVALLLRRWGIRLMAGLLERMAHRSPSVETGLRQTQAQRLVPAVTGAVVFWVVFVAFLAAAVETLGLPVVTNLLSRAAAFLPKAFAAVAIVFVGMLLSYLARGVVTAGASTAGIAYADALGRVVQGTVLVVAVVMGVDEVGIDSTLLVVTLGIVFATAFGGVALAFGLGARAAVHNLIASHYILQTYRVGHTVRIGDVEGRILQITGTAVVLQAEGSRVIVPAGKFADEPAVLTTPEG